MALGLPMSFSVDWLRSMPFVLRTEPRPELPIHASRVFQPARALCIGSARPQRSPRIEGESGG